MLRRWRAAWPRRGRIWSAPPLQLPAPQPTTVEPARRPTARPRRRGQFFPVVPVAAAPAAPATVPSFTRARVRPAVSGRRARFQPGPPPAVPAPAPTIARGRARTVRPGRRGQVFPVVPVVAAAAPAMAPSWTHTRVRPGLLARRGRYVDRQPNGCGTPIVQATFETGTAEADLTVGAGVSVVTAPVYAGGFALKLQSDGATGAEALWRSVASLGAGRTVLAGTLRFNPEQFSTDFARVLYANTADGVCRFYLRTTDGTIRCLFSGGVEITGPVVGAGWHRLEFRVSLDNTQHTCDWTVDGTSQPQALSQTGLAPTTITDVVAGSPAGVTATLYVDNVAFGVQACDYRLLPEPPGNPVPLGVARGRSRRLGLLARRGRIFTPVPVAPVAPPPTVPAFTRARVRPGLRARRGRFWLPTWPPVLFDLAAAAGVGAAGRPRPAALPTRRAAVAEPPWPQVQAQPSVWRPGWVRALPRLAGRPARRGDRFEPPWPEGPQTVWRPGMVRATVRRAGWPVRRAGLFEPPWPQVQAQPDVWRPGMVRATLRLAGRPVRRSGLLEPPWPQGPQTVWRPDLTRQTPRLAGRPTRRSNYHEPPWPQAQQAAATVPAALVGRRRPVAGLARRGRYQPLPPRPAGVPAWLRTRPRPLPSQSRRARLHEPPWPEGPQTVWRPPFQTRPGVRGRFAAYQRRGCMFEPRWPQGDQGIIRDLQLALAGPDAKWRAAGPTGSGWQTSGPDPKWQPGPAHR